MAKREAYKAHREKWKKGYYYVIRDELGGFQKAIKQKKGVNKSTIEASYIPKARMGRYIVEEVTDTRNGNTWFLVYGRPELREEIIEKIRQSSQSPKERDTSFEEEHLKRKHVSSKKRAVVENMAKYV